MNLDDFQRAAWNSGKGYPQMGQGDASLSFPALRLAEESGEVVGIVKRLIFRLSSRDLSSRKREELLAALMDEMGDTLHALAQIATEAGMQLDDVAEIALLKQQARGAGRSEWNA